VAFFAVYLAAVWNGQRYTESTEFLRVMRHGGWLILLLCSRWLSAETTTFEQGVQPFLKKHCTGCHNDKNANGGLDLKQFSNQHQALAKPEVWERVLERLQTGDMPPKPLPRPASKQQEAVASWIDSSLKRLDAEQKPDPGRVTARRLNRVEYANTIRDLVGVKFDPSSDFPADDSGYGFDNNGDVLSLSPVLLERYLKAAGNIARAAIVAPGDRIAPSRERISLDGSLPGESSPRRPLQANVEVDLPASADYRLVVRIKDNRRKPVDGGVLLVQFSNQKEMSFSIAGASNQDNFITEYELPQFFAKQGVHALSVKLLNSSMQLEKVADAKDPTKYMALMSAELRGPFNVKSAGPHTLHRKFLPCAQPSCEKQVLKSWMRRSFRRPVSEAEVTRLANLSAKARKQGASFEESMQVALQAILVSPHFLFRVERLDALAPNALAPNARLAEVRSLNGYEIASRLSYFLWSTMPDEALFAAADSGALTTEAGLQKEVRRMLADSKAASLVKNFAGQWLQLRNVLQAKPDKDLFPKFNQELRSAMIRETELFFDEIIRKDRSIVDLFNGKFTYLNQTLAEHYGIADVKGAEFRRVELDGQQRGGILTHASVLTISSYPTRTSPVIRGIWVLENLLGTPPPPPPPDVPELEAAKAEKGASLRKILELHRANPTCASCHAKFDPLGFGLENYDAIGRWRETESGVPVDSSGVMPSGRTFKGPAQLKEILAQDADLLARAMTRKLMTYGLGRGLERYDRPAVEKIVQRMKQDGYKFSSMVLGITESLPFQNRRQDVAMLETMPKTTPKTKPDPTTIKANENIVKEGNARE
jgi:hypothetical protein